MLTMFFAISGCFSLLVLIVSTFSPATNGAKCDCNTVFNLVKGMKMQLTDIQKKLKSSNQGEKLYLFAISLVNRKFNAADDFQRTIQEIIQIKFDVCLSFFSVYKNCAELYKSGRKISGVYTIDPDGSGSFDVFCDQTTAGGGWTVFQKRLDGSVNFYRGWHDYKLGFGNLNGEFWLGLDKINRLTRSARNRLRVDLEDTKGKTAYAEYDHFAVTSERSKYQLSLGTYSGEYSFKANASLVVPRGTLRLLLRERRRSDFANEVEPTQRYPEVAYVFRSVVNLKRL